MYRRRSPRRGDCPLALCCMAFGLGVLLALCGIVYVLEALSDILQVGDFRATGGKRLFKMAPLHHHFELCGLSEGRIDLLFTLVSVAGCALAWLAYVRYFPML